MDEGFKADRPALLGIECSVLHRRWRLSLTPAATREAEAIAQIAGLPDILARVVAARGVTLSALDNFLDPKLRDLMPDPDSLADMDRAVAALVPVIEARSRVAVFGDYDVDGACSSALMGLYLRALDVPHEIYIPDRIFEGYGPNSEAIRQLAARGARTLITVDCGSTSNEPLKEAKRLGLKVVVLDHHQVGDDLPEADALVNPNRQDDLSGQGMLAAAGVVFLTLVALNRALRETGFFACRPEPDLIALIDLVALATVADVVPLTGLNRAFVTQGLKMMRQRRRLGLNALIDSAKLGRPVEPHHLGFILGPRINAGGRIGDAALGARLLMSDSLDEAQALAAELEGLNRDRQDAEKIMVEEAIAQAEAAFGIDGSDELNVIVTGSADWHPGIVGLIAARLKERFRRPAFAFALNGEVGTASGSGRSVPGVDLGRAVRAALEAGYLIKGGGHAMAAGATIMAAARSTGALEAFRAYLEASIGRDASLSREADALDIDAVLSAGGANADLIRLIERAGPYGQGNPEPVFVFPEHRLVSCSAVGSGGHLRLSLKAPDGATLNAIAFRAEGQPLGVFLQSRIGKAVHLAGTLSLDSYGGRERIDLRVMDAAE